MHHDGTWIEITRAWIDAAIVRNGRIALCHRFWRSDDPASADTLAADIHASLESLGTRPRRVHVLWSAQGIAVDLCAAPLPGSAGLRAVRLSHAAAAGLTPGLDPTAAAPISPPPRRASPDAPPTLVIAAGMSAQLWKSLRDGIHRAGGTLGRVHSTHAAALRDTALAALHPDPNPIAVAVAVAVDIDEDGSAIAIAIDNRIALARTIDLGASALRRSYDLALRDAGRTDSDPNTPPIAATADDALHKHGIPARDEALPHGASADLVFQYMRAALQRIVFEVKQSIRFSSTESGGPDDAARVRPQLRIVRHTIPNLPALLAKECNALLVTTPEAIDTAPGARILRAITLGSPIALDPPNDSAASAKNRARWATVAGSAAALALVAADAATTNARAATALRTAQELEARLDGAPHIDIDTAHLAEAIRDSEAIISREIGPVAHWSGSLAAAATELGDAATLTRISGDRSASRSTLRLEGELAAPTPGDAHQALTDAVARLRTSPLFASVEVPVIDQEARPSASVLAFTIEITLKECPPAWVAEVSP